MKHAADKIQSRLPRKDLPRWKPKLLDQIVLFPIDGEFDAAAAAHHAAGPATQRDTIAARRAHGIMLPDVHRQRDVPGARHDGPFPRRRIRHLKEGTDDCDGCPFHIDDGGEALGLDEAVPGAATQVAVHISLKTSPHHQSRSGRRGDDKINKHRPTTK